MANVIETAPPTGRLRTILVLSLPIVGGMVSQNILNLVDTAMVGRVSTTALAAVGLASFTNFMAIAIILGLGTGVQAIASRRKGEGKENETAIPLNGGLFLALIIGIPLTVVLYYAAPLGFPLLDNDPDVVKNGVPYLQARILGTVAIAMNYAFRGFWNGINMSMIYMRTLIVMHVINIFLNWVLIFGNLGAPTLGAEGAGLATTISIFVGTGLYAFQAWHLARDRGFLDRLPRRETLLGILRISIPASIQQFFFAAGFTALFLIIGQIGTSELAAASVLMNVSQTAFLPGLGLGIACASMVGQALGRGDPDDAKAWGWDVVKVGIAVMGTIGVPMIFFPAPILAIFLTDPSVIEMARPPLILVGMTIWFEAVSMILLSGLQGAGAAQMVAKISVGLQWLLFLPLAYVVGPYLGYGLLGVWAWFIIYRLITTIIYAGVWQFGKWQHIKV
ncbi:MAG: MATE family efflux transporter [Rhodospirillaceae bacterium]|nr:MATE family efflux transporter [Rhodospirillaceae bacterium]